MSIPVVYDTMIFLQAAARPNRVHATLQFIKDGRVTLCLSAALLLEVRAVLTRSSLRAKFPALTAEAVEAFLEDIIVRGTVFNPPPVFAWPEHPDDEHLLNLAIHAQARYLVTWEKRILRLPASGTEAGNALSRLAAQLAILTPPGLIDELRLAKP